MYLGLMLAALGGSCDASMAFVMGLAKRWRWENIWLVWAIFGCLVLPWVTVFIFLRKPSPIEVYGQVPIASLVKVLVFGAAWGLGAVLFGLGIVRVGMGLGLGIIVSLTAAIGALLPLFQKDRELLVTPQAGIIYVAVALLVSGIVLCAMAANRRKVEKPLLEREPTDFALGLVYCILSGFLSPMVNLAFTAGIDINNAAAKLSASPLGAGIAPVAPIMSAGFIVNAIYCIYLLNRNRTWSDFARADTISHWLYGFTMGLLQMMGFLIYTVAASRIDKSTELGGTVLGWPVYTAVVILVGNLEGLIRGEWRGSDRRTFALLFGGLAALIIASAMVAGLGAYLAKESDS
jgi:L-rhamnose-H+ transport protein